MFNNYYSKTERSNLLSNLFESINVTNFKILEKHPVFDHHQSDFDVVKVLV